MFPNTATIRLRTDGFAECLTKVTQFLSPSFMDLNLIIAKKGSVTNLGYFWNHVNNLKVEEVC